ncbi:ferrous iron transport protein A [Flaviflexus equikiangi]|uniref:Ferrous iron transport protein A n=1 Tax=Flaviflexus equikiangi TaxID=2758573 RepID=A0ABS2TG55_9ACTO|nr:ferrous iron transport protein A [Flaviflexus equikiangi]MBM9433643.1 ferrous iron transport protein A [Flaviflexus equikiangi]
MKLSSWPANQQARVVSLGIESGRLRARELGLRPGAIVRVTQRTLFGGTVLDIDGGRLALDRAAAARIHVEPCDGVPMPKAIS